MSLNKGKVYECWLSYSYLPDNFNKEYRGFCNSIVAKSKHPVINSAVEELKLHLPGLPGNQIVESYPDSAAYLWASGMKQMIKHWV